MHVYAWYAKQSLSICEQGHDDAHINCLVGYLNDLFSLTGTTPRGSSRQRMMCHFYYTSADVIVKTLDHPDEINSDY